MLKTSVHLAISLAIILGIGLIWYQTSKSSDIEIVQKTDSYSTSSQPTTIATTTKNDTSINNTKKIMNATLHTTKGDITIQFSEQETPNTVANFIKLAQSGFYDGTKFHRVIKNFMIQGGDPLSKDDTQMARWGTGGPGYTFADEIGSGNRNDTGTIAMANAGPNTNGSQFFINVKDNNFLDTKHTVFGKITGGMDIVKAIEAVETTASDRPLDAVVITKVTLK